MGIPLQVGNTRCQKNNKISLDSATDRIVDTVTTTEQDANGIWRVTRKSTYAQESSAQPKLVTTSRVKLAGFTSTQIGRSESSDISNNTTTQTTTLSGKVRETRIARPGVAAEEISVSYADRLTYLYQPGIADPHIFGYDSLGRRVSSKQPRHTQAAITAYFPGSDLIATETDAAGNPTSFTYHPQGSYGAGEIKTTTLADTTVQYRVYTLRGETQVTWGTQTYPTWNVYDTYGQLKNLHTWQVAPGLDINALPVDPPAGSALTTWNHDLATGLLTNKRDATDKGADYEYDIARRLTKRTWARTTAGGITRLATIYTPDAFGEITNIDYTDSTPDVAIVHDRLGRRFTVTQTNQSKITYAYDPANLALDTETVQYDIDQNGTYEFERVLDRSRDTLNRNNGFQLKNSTTIETEASYAFSPSDGRLSEISNPQISNQQFAYQYRSNSDLLEKVTGPAHEVVNTYEPNRDVLDTKTNKLVSTVISAYDYAVNAIGQRTGVTTSGTAFPNVPSWIWGYDSLGQVTSADSSVNASDRAYQHDAIGNRKKAANSLTLPSADNYTANALNQYSSLSIPDPQSPISNPSYDFDGNATAYPLPTSPTTNSTLIWDAENRLTEVKSSTGTTLEKNVFDSGSRKIATIANGITTLYLYDAWNCIAEYQFNIQNSSFSIAKTRLWGTDLSGSMQGAGGVGGLLTETHVSAPQSPSYYPTYDGNGNASEYLDSTGQVTAHFEYDPFGNTVVNTDSGNQFAYRFSTKPLAFATGLYYYGYRYYDPVTGRWPSRDPIGERGGINLYGFVSNRPIKVVDTDGRQLYLGQPPEDVFIVPPPDDYGFGNQPIIDPPPVAPPDGVPPNIYPPEGKTGKYICRKRKDADGSSQEGILKPSGDGTHCCLDARCSYECTAIEREDADPEGELLEFKFKICGKDKEKVNYGTNGNHLSAFCPDVIELTATMYKNGAFSTGDIPENSPPTNLAPFNMP